MFLEFLILIEGALGGLDKNMLQGSSSLILIALGMKEFLAAAEVDIFLCS